MVEGMPLVNHVERFSVLLGKHHGLVLLLAFARARVRISSRRLVWTDHADNNYW